MPKNEDWFSCVKHYRKAKVCVDSEVGGRILCNLWISWQLQRQDAEQKNSHMRRLKKQGLKGISSVCYLKDDKHRVSLFKIFKLVAKMVEAKGIGYLKVLWQ